MPQAITSPLSASRRGAASLAPSVSAARTAKPSTLERSKGGASTARSHRRQARGRAPRRARPFLPPRAKIEMLRNAPAPPAAIPRRGTAPAAPHGARRRGCQTPASAGPAFLHGHGLTADRCRRIAFAVRRHDDPAIGLRQRGQREIARCQRLDAIAACGALESVRRGRAMRSPCGSVAVIAVLSSSALVPASRASNGRPSMSQTASAASSRPGTDSTGRVPTNPNAAVSPGQPRCRAHRHARAAQARARLPSRGRSGATDDDHGVDCCSLERLFGRTDLHAGVADLAAVAFDRARPVPRWPHRSKASA